MTSSEAKARKLSHRNRADAANEYVGLASHFLACRDIDSTLAYSEEALRLGASRESVAYQRWVCFMLRGDFESAWQETDRMEAIRRRELARSRDCHDNLPLHLRRVWDGSPLDGRDVLVRCYHGLGDTIQFIRYLLLLKRRAARVYLQCQRELAALLAALPYKDAMFFIGDDCPISSLPVEVELMELAYALRTRLETIPAEIPYLHVPVSTYPSPEFARTNGKLKIGLAWSSGAWEAARNIPLEKIAGLADARSVALFSLQRGAAADEIAGNRSLRITQTEAEGGTIADTAATIMDLDLVISVDTMVAHVAGALGKPVWLLLPFCADWRWMLDRDDSPWYPTMRIFRQPRPGEWDAVIESLVSALHRLVHC